MYVLYTNMFHLASEAGQVVMGAEFPVVDESNVYCEYIHITWGGWQA